MTQLRLSGRYVDDDYDTEGRETAVEVQLDGATRSLLVASARTGVFTGRFAQVVGRRRVRLIVRIRAGDDFAAFHVQVRLGRRRGSLVAIVSDPRIRPRRLTVPPVRPRRPR